MPSPYTIPVWKSSPFLRLLPPFIAGILLHWYTHPSFQLEILSAAFSIALFFSFRFLPLAFRFRFQWLHGIALNLVIFCAGAMLNYQKDIRNDSGWFGRRYNDSTLIIAKINEPPVEKDRSFKAEAVAEEMMINGSMKKVTGKLIVYFAKDSAGSVPVYGDRIMIRGGIQKIKNSGNPGAFDYEQYMGFQQIYHQAYLKTNNWVLLPDHHRNSLYSFIFFMREKLVNILRQNIKGDKKVTGISEALFIGYKEDLDKNTVQAYRNTGVVHIIIIAGMHLGLISAALVWFFSRLPGIKCLPLLKLILIISCVWLFALLTGGSVPVLRSAVMFTCIMIGKNFSHQPKVYNSLAASAFLLLCYDPFFLWDTGFQLSYAAVTGIVWLQKPISLLIYTPNSFLLRLWELCSLSLSAQLFTMPLCIYYFHQLPVTFLITNIICVPLFTVILFTEIFLVGEIWSPALAGLLGKFAYTLTWLMNFVINTCNGLPFALISNIYSTPLTTYFLYGCIIFVCSGLMTKKKQFIKWSLCSLAAFIICWGYGKTAAFRQKKIIVYNISRHTAVDFIRGSSYCFYGDAELKKPGSLRDQFLAPARIALQAEDQEDTLKELQGKRRFHLFYDKKIMIIDSAVRFEAVPAKIKIDLLLICGNPKISIADITGAISPAIIVFDASNSVWKIGQWKKECEQLHLPCYSVAEKGAYILSAN